jgi:hypothetical protein
MTWLTNARATLTNRRPVPKVVPATVVSLEALIAWYIITSWPGWVAATCLTLYGLAGVGLLLIPYVERIEGLVRRRPIVRPRGVVPWRLPFWLAQIMAGPFYVVVSLAGAMILTLAAVVAAGLLAAGMLLIVSIQLLAAAVWMRA